VLEKHPFFGCYQHSTF